MKINRIPGNGSEYMNEQGIVLTNRWNQGTGDSLGRTARASLIYEDQELIAGIKSYFFAGRKDYSTWGKIYVTRYPGNEMDDYLRGNSRDHVIKAIAALKLKGEHAWVRNFLKKRVNRPCIEHGYTPFQKIWFLALYSHFWSIVYLVAKLPEMLLRMGADRLLMAIGQYSKPATDPTAFYRDQKEPSKLQLFLSKNELIMPTYAYFYTIYELRTLHNRFISRCLLKLHSLNFEKTNYVCRAMCLRRVKWPENYVPTRKNRWNVRLDESNDRDMRPYPGDIPENNQELAMFEYYKNNQKS